MSIEVAICPTCGMRYNGTDYKACPYCASGAGSGTRKGTRGESGNWTWPWRKPAPQPVEEEEAGEPVVPADSEEPVPAPSENRPEPCRHTIGYEAIPGGEPIRQTADNGVRADPPAPQAGSSARKTGAGEAAAGNLPSQIQALGKTTAKYINTAGGDVSYPAVGWLVCVKGVYYGQSFPLKSGVNKVGRSPDLDVQLLRDDSVSRSAVVKIIYDAKGDEFNALPGDSSSLCYINGQALYSRVLLAGFEEIELGDEEKNKFVFVPLCGERFQWSRYPMQDRNEMK